MSFVIWQVKGLIDFLRTLISTLDKNTESRVILIKYWLGLNQTIMVYNPTTEGIRISVLFLKSKVCVNLYSHWLLYKTILYTIETGVQIIVHNQLGLPDMPKPSRHSLPVNWADHVTRPRMLLSQLLHVWMLTSDMWESRRRMKRRAPETSRLFF